MELFITIFETGLELLIVPLAIILYFRSRSVRIVDDRTMLYLCAEMVHSISGWPQIAAKIRGREKERIKIPLSASCKGVFGYPLMKAAILLMMFLLFTVLAELTFSLVSGYVDLELLASKKLKLSVYIALISAPLVAYYLIPLSVESNSMSSGTTLLKSFLEELEWDDYPEERLDKVYKQVEVDFLLYKKDVELGAVGFYLVLSGTIMYTRFFGQVIDGRIIGVLVFLLVLFILKSLYESYRTRKIILCLNALLELKAELKAASGATVVAPPTADDDGQEPPQMVSHLRPDQSVLEATDPPGQQL